MSYSYVNERPWVFTEDAQVQFLSIRDRAQKLIEISGAATLGEIIRKESGSSWRMIACVDRLVELKWLREVKTEKGTWGQDRIFTR